MKSKFKRTLAVILSCSFVFALVGIGAVGSATYSAKTEPLYSSDDKFIELNSVEEVSEFIINNPETYDYNADGIEEKVPVIILPGISQSISYLANEDGTPALNKDGKELKGGLLIIDESTIYNTILSKLLVPLTQTLIFQKDMGFTDAVYDTICEAFSIQASDLHGNPVNNLQTITYEYPVSEMSPEDKDKFYRAIPMQPVTDLIGEDYLYVFAFPLISKPMDNAENLHEFIQLVKAQKGVDKVTIVSISLGGTILTAYLDLDHVDGSDIHQIINVVSVLQGSDLMADFYAREFNLADEFVFSDYIPMVLEETSGSAALGYIINIAIRILPRDVFEKTLTRAVDGILDTLLVNCPQFWTLVSADRYEAVADKHLSGEGYEELRGIMDRFHTAQLNLKDNLLALNAKGVRVNNICGYDLDYSSYDYNFFAIMKSSGTTSSDGILNIDSTSLGASYAPAGTALPEDYTPKAPGYISPDGNIDASSCLFPDNVWFFQGQHHEVGRNDVVIKLCGQLISGDIKSVADKADAFPQFNGNRNTKTLTRNLLPECEEVLANSWNYNYDDVIEVQAAYDEAQYMLSSTICNSSETEAVTERVLNSLRRVGVREEAENEDLLKVLDIVAKAVNDIIYDIFGPGGFSDWPKNNIVLPSINSIAS